MSKKHRRQKDQAGRSIPTKIESREDMRAPLSELLTDAAKALGVAIGERVYYAEAREEGTGLTVPIIAAAMMDPQLPHPLYGLWLMRGKMPISITDAARAYSQAIVPERSEHDILAGAPVARAVLDACRRGLAAGETRSHSRA